MASTATLAVRGWIVVQWALVFFFGHATCPPPPNCKNNAATVRPLQRHIRPAGCSSAAGATGAVVGAAPAALGLHGTLLAGEPGESDGGVGEEVTALDRIRQYHE